MTLYMDHIHWMEGGKTLLNIAQDTGFDLTEFDALSLCASRLSCLEELQEITRHMPQLRRLDLSYNKFSGPEFFTWICQWLRSVKGRVVDITYNPRSCDLRDAALKMGIKTLRAKW